MSPGHIDDVSDLVTTVHSIVGFPGCWLTKSAQWSLAKKGDSNLTSIYRENLLLKNYNLVDYVTGCRIPHHYIIVTSQR